MKKYFFVLFSILTFPLLAETESVYFRRVYVDARNNQICTEDSISKDVAHHGICYKVLYNEIGKISSYSKLINGEMAPIERNIFTVNIKYSNNIETREFRNMYGNPSPNLKGVYKIAITTDSDTRNVTNFDKNAKLISDSLGVAKYVYSVNEKRMDNGRILL